MTACPSLVMNSKRRGEVCGRPIRGFVAKGEGRCAYHLTERERLRLVAIRRAEREMRELRALEPEQRQDEPEPGGDEQPESGVRFDPERFASAELDE